MPGDEVASEPHHHAANVGKMPFVVEHLKKPSLKFTEPPVADIEAVVVLSVDSRWIDSLLGMNV